MTLEVIPVLGLPEIGEGDDVAAAIVAATQLRDGDLVVVASKVVAKAEGAVVTLAAGVDPATARRELARRLAVDVLVDSPTALIVRTRHGLVCANGGIDASNAPEGTLILLPEDPDASARGLRDDLRRRASAEVGVIVTDTFGRPWREGQTDVAVGVAGVAALRDERGGVDRGGHPLTATQVAVADELAAAADLVRRKAEGVPVVVVRGYPWRPDPGAAATDLVRQPAADLFPRGRGMLAAAIARSWPSAWAGGVTRQDLDAVAVVAPSLTMGAEGPPSLLAGDDPLQAGLAVAVLADLGLAVRWRHDDGTVVVEAGRPAAGR